MYFLTCFMVLLRQSRRLYTSGPIFQVPLGYNYSTYRTNRVLTRSVHQVRVYAFGAPTTRLRVWCTYEALTNQGGGASVYRPHSLLYTIDSYYYPKEHTILYVFRAPGYNSLVLLSWYKQIYIIESALKPVISRKRRSEYSTATLSIQWYYLGLLTHR